MSEPKDPRLFDRRIVERNIRKGLVTRKEYDAFLKTLGDSTEKMAPPQTDDDIIDDDDDDDMDDVEDEADAAPGNNVGH
jgi:hypothetical protein